MRLIRLRGSGRAGPHAGGPRVGVLDEAAVQGDGAGPGTVTTLAGSPALADLLALPVSELRDVLADPGGEQVPLDGLELLAPVDGRTEGGAAGVPRERPQSCLQFAGLSGPGSRPVRLGPRRLPDRCARARAGGGAQLRRR